MNMTTEPTWFHHTRYPILPIKAGLFWPQILRSPIPPTKSPKWDQRMLRKEVFGLSVRFPKGNSLFVSSVCGRSWNIKSLSISFASLSPRFEHSACLKATRIVSALRRQEGRTILIGRNAWRGQTNVTPVSMAVRLAKPIPLHKSHSCSFTVTKWTFSFILVSAQLPTIYAHSRIESMGAKSIFWWVRRTEGRFVWWAAQGVSRNAPISNEEASSGIPYGERKTSSSASFILAKEFYVYGFYHTEDNS